MKKDSILSFIVFCSLLFGQETKGLSPVLRSLLLPGLGEYALNNHSRAHKFLITETILWTSFAGALISSSKYSNLFQAFAANYANVNPDNKDRQFWVDVGNYTSREDHNEEHLRFREYEALYPLGNEWAWVWVSDDKKRQYRNYRVLSDKWSLTAKFIAGGIVMNHLISAIDTLYLQRIAHLESITVLPVYAADVQETGLSIQFHF